MAILRVYDVVDTFSSEKERKPRVDENSAYAVENGAVETFRITVLFWCVRNSSLVSYLLLP